jgi:hypothetical protein
MLQGYLTIKSERIPKTISVEKSVKKLTKPRARTLRSSLGFFLLVLLILLSSEDKSSPIIFYDLAISNLCLVSQ